MSEKDLLQSVRDLAALRGWLAYHTFDSRRSEPGFPDVVLAHRSRGVVFVELKSEGGQLTPPQALWLATLAAAGAEVMVVRPRDLLDLDERLTRTRRYGQA